MKILNKISILPLALSMAFVACDSEEELIEERIAENTVEVTFTEGSANFSNYVALGNSLTAGFMDAALYNEGQANSFPNIIGGQLIEAGFAASFDQPDINSELGFNTAIPNPQNGTIFGHFILDTSIPGPVPTVGGDPITAFSGNKSALNNFGVPGARTAGLLSPALASNPFYARFATSPGASTVLSDALATNPTFFSLWIGSNDVLGYALAGGTGNDPLVDYGQAQFTSDYSTIIGGLLNSGAKGVVINVPPVLLIPFLRAVPYNAIGLTENEAAQLNAGLAGVNNALDAIVAFLGHDADDAARRKISYSAGPNPILVIDEELEDLGPKFDMLQGAGAISAQQRAQLVPYEQSRPLTQGELVLLSAGRVLGTEADGDDSSATPPTTIGVIIPLGFDLATGSLSGDQWYLTMDEQTAIVTARATYNAVIAGIVMNTPGVEMLDIQPLFADIAGLSPEQAAQLALSPASVSAADGVQGITYEGVRIAPDFSPSGIFSTDGIHPNPRGHAIVANELIKLINASYGSNIPQVNTTTFRTVLFE